MKPHRFARMVNEVRELAFQYGHMEQFRCRVADLLGKYIHVEHNSKGAPEQSEIEAHAVVVPEPDGSSAGLVNVRSWIGAIGPVGAMVWVDPWEAMKAAGVRAIPSDRVLGDGMVAAMEDALLPSTRTKAMHMGEYSFTIMDSDEDGDEIPRKIDVPWTTVKEIMRAIRSDALRANQGGAAT